MKVSLLLLVFALPLFAGLAYATLLQLEVWMVELQHFVVAILASAAICCSTVAEGKWKLTCVAFGVTTLSVLHSIELTSVSWSVFGIVDPEVDWNGMHDPVFTLQQLLEGWLALCTGVLASILVRFLPAYSRDG